MAVLLFFDNNSLVSPSAAFWASATSIILFTLLHTAREAEKPLILLMTLITSFWFLLRVIILAVFPESIAFQPYVDYQASDITSGLAYLCLATIALGIGMKFGSRVLARREIERAPVMPPSVLPERVVWLGLALSALGLFSYLDIGAGRFSEALAPIGWIFQFLNYEIILALLALLIVTQARFFTRYQRRMVLVYYISFTLYRVLVGSRGGLYLVVLYWVLASIAAKGDLRVTRKAIGWLVFAAVLVVPFYYFATSTRVLWSPSADRSGSISISDVLAAANGADLQLVDAVKELSGRVSALDSLALVVSHKGRESDRYMNWTNVIHVIVNDSVPGEIWPEAFPTTRAFTIIYWGYPEAFARSVYISNLWTLYGLAYVFWGWYLGLIATFCIGFILALVYSYICRSSHEYALPFRLFWLAVITQGILNYGFEFWWVYASQGLAVGVIYVLIVKRRTKSAKHGLPWRIADPERPVQA